MKLIAMKFRGVGPYRGEYAIDFAALSRSRMFLIDGETGAGKTTILDCLSFALYGSISSNVDGRSGAGDRQRIRSRFLDTDPTETYVDLIFRSAGAYYEVRRTPEYERLKQRGEGTVQQRASAKLMRIDDGLGALVEAAAAPSADGMAGGSGGSGGSGGASGGGAIAATTADGERYFQYAAQAGHGKEITSRVGEVTPQIEQLLGLDRRQFSKTIMLAQGQFSDFLRMKPEERTGLVKDLFAAQEYEDIQNMLDCRRLAEQRGVEQRRSDVISRVEAARHDAAQIRALLAQWRAAEQATGVEAEAARSGDGTASDGSGTGATVRESVVDVVDAVDAVDADETDEAACWGMTAGGDLDEPASDPQQIAQRVHRAAGDTREDLDRLRLCADAAITRMDQALETAKRRHDAVDTLRGIARQERHALEHVHALRERHDRIRDDGRLLDRSRQAAPIMSQRDTLLAAAQRRDQAARDLARTEERLLRSDDRQTLDQRYETALAASARQDEAKRQRELADGHAELLQQARKARQQVEQADQQMQQAMRRVEQAQQAVAALPQQSEVDDEYAQLSIRLGTRGELDERVAAARRLHDHAVKHQNLQAELIRQEQRLQDAGQAADDARWAADAAQHAIARSEDARYAIRLAEGEPCPVCGSVDHPSPASMPDDVPSARQLEALRTRAEQCDAEYQRIRDRERELRVSVRSEAEHAEGLSVEEANQRVKQAQAAVTALKAVDRRLAELREIRNAIDQARQQLVAADKRLEAARAQAQAMRQTLDQAVAATGEHTDASVAAERQAADTALSHAQEQARVVASLQRQIRERDELDKRCVKERSAVEALTAQVTECERQLDALVAGSVFADAQQAAEAVLTERETRQVTSRIEQYRSEVIAAVADIRRIRSDSVAPVRSAVAALPSLASIAATLPGGVLPSGVLSSEATASGVLPGEAISCDVLRGEALAPVASSAAGMPADVRATGVDQLMEQMSALGTALTCDDGGALTAIGEAIESLDLADGEAAVRRAEQARQHALREQGKVQQLDQEYAEHAKAALRAVDEWRQAMEAFAPLRRMASLANADSASPAKEKITLITYAVTERFRDVLDRANELLKDIHGGVYELRLGGHEGRVGGRTGLPIEVFDRRTELSREPSTLSGGETFFVSLALALSLADVIQAENGGISMDTLFVDEGFGSLSDEYLEDVLDVLRRIARTRDVGIISHVGQLKDQIPERISVTRVRPDGESRLAVIA